MEKRATAHHLVFVLAWLIFAPSVQCLGTAVLEGDVYIQVIGTVYTILDENGTCSEIDSQAVQNIEAIRWILEELKSNGFLSGGIGLRVSETCGSVTRAETLALQLAAELENGTSTDVIGVIGPGHSVQSQAVSRLLSSLPEQHRLLQMEYAATSTSLFNKDIYKNVLTTVPTDDVQIKAMQSLLQKLRWTYIAIIYEDNEHGRGLKNALLEETQSRDICFPVELPVDSETSTTESLVENIQRTMVNASVPVSGAIVLGSRTFADGVTKATELAMTNFPDQETPVFLFSDNSEYAVGTDKDRLQGGFALSLPQNEISEFKEHWNNLFESDTTLDQFTEPYKSWLNASNNIGQSVYNQYAIQAALVIAKAVKSVCLSSDCGQLKTIPKQTFIDTIRGLTVDFDNDFNPIRINAFRNPDLIVMFNDEMVMTRPSEFSLYEAYNLQKCGAGNTCMEKINTRGSASRVDLSIHNRLEKYDPAISHTVVAYLTSEHFVFIQDNIRDYDRDEQVLSWPNVRKAQCPNGFTCDVCRGQQQQSEFVLFEPGDLYVIGIVPVHNPGETPLQCGEIKSGGLDIVESIRFAIKDAPSSFAGIIPSGKVGVVIIDSCNDAHIILEKILSLHRYGVLQDGKYVHISDKIIGYIGGWSSDVSTAVVSITSRLGVVQIAYASTAPRLSNTQLYPYFLRTPTPDDAQADTLLRIVKHFESNLIQILYSETAYGEGGRDAVQELAGNMDVCIAQAIGVRRASNPADIVRALRQHSDAKVVICFLGSFEIEPLVNTLNDDLKWKEFIFISSEGWGTRVDVSEFSNLVGSITLTSELPNQKFKDHLRSLNPSDATTNPWLREYMENYFHCFYEVSMDKKEGEPCSDSNRLDEHSADYIVDVWSSFAERAVLSLLQGAKQALDEMCGDSGSVCDDFRTNPDRLFTKTKQITFRDEGGNTRSRAFDDNGDGLAGYKIYVVDDNNKYKRIGAGDVKTFTFDDSLYPRSSVINSTCGVQDYCQVCFTKTTTSEDGGEDLPIMWIALVSVLALVCIILGLTVVCVYRKLGCCLTLEGGRLKMSDAYLTPIHVHRRRKTEGTNLDRYEEDYDSIQDAQRHTAPGNDYITASLSGRGNQLTTSDPGMEELQQNI